MHPRFRFHCLVVVLASACLLSVACQKPKINPGPFAAGEGQGKGKVSQEAADQARTNALDRQRPVDEQTLADGQAAPAVGTGDTSAEGSPADAARIDRELFELEDIYFEFDSSALTPEAMTVLERKAEWVLTNPGIRITIEGHCDERGTNEYNIALGDRRAEAAKSFLTDLGVPPASLASISYGEERPVDPGDSEDARAKNRRCHFVVD